MKLKELRLKKGYTQKDFAEIVGIKYRTYQDYEQGRILIDNTDLATLLRICITLGCPINDIIENEDTLKLLDEYNKII